jgi:DNA recombination protein RmuC
MRSAGVELYNRTANLLGHFSNIGNSLNAAVKNYNQAVSSLESRFIPQAKKLQALSGSFTSKEVPDVEPVELNARAVAEMIIENNNNPVT